MKQWPPTRPPARAPFTSAMSPVWRRRRRLFAVAGGILVALFYIWRATVMPGMYDDFTNPNQDYIDPDHDDIDLGVPSSDVGKGGQLARPRKIMGLVFYGRRETVSILDCYLKRNLVKNGGVLDGVIFVERTRTPSDLVLLDHLIATEPDYIRWRVDPRKSGYTAAYDLVEDDVMYVKIDDDVVFIEDDAIRSIVRLKRARPDLFIVSANVVNQPLSSWTHWNLGAVKPYLPELDPGSKRPAPLPRRDQEGLDWRASRLPSWTGPAGFNAIKWDPSTAVKHRWLPVRHGTPFVLAHTLIAETNYDAFGPGWRKWQIGAQEHYSLLENIEKDELWRYHFHLWDFQNRRMGIQFIAVMGADINRAKPIPADDEQHLAVTMPKRLHRRAVAHGKALAAHYSFSPQRKTHGGMESTDILERYRSLANETVCAGRDSMARAGQAGHAAKR